MKAVIRGAISAENNKESVTDAVCTLWDSITEANKIGIDEISCIILSQTNDINSTNCASALRKGRNITDIPLFCVQEAYTEMQINSIIRILIITDRTITDRNQVKHIYMRNASQLRPDLAIRKDTSNEPCLTTV